MSGPPDVEVSDDDVAFLSADAGNFPLHGQLLSDEALARSLAFGSDAPAVVHWDDEALARRLAEEEAGHGSQQALHDEAMARRLSSSFDDNGSVVTTVDADTSCPSKYEQGRSSSSASIATIDPVVSPVAGPQEVDLAADVLKEVNSMWVRWQRGESATDEASGKTDKPPSPNYSLHAVHQLLHEFACVPAQAVKSAFLEYGSYTETRRHLQSANDLATMKHSRPKRSSPPCPVPRVLSREMKHGLQTTSAASVFKERQAAHAARVEELKALGGLGTCSCCFDDEVLPEDELRCTAAAGHGFCIPCVKQQAVTFFTAGLFTINLADILSTAGSGSSSARDPAGAAMMEKTVVKCMHTSGCNGHFTDVALQKCLPDKEYVRYSQRSAALHAASSGLQDLAACPACDFMVQMSDHSDTVVKCQSPECGKVSCRWCQGDDHRPLACHEVEKDGEVRIRTFLEESMANFSLKRCPNPKCQKAYERVEGCNHMKCPGCHTHSCYLCGQLINKARPYDHYKDGEKGGGTADKNSRCVVYGTPAWAKKSEEDAFSEAQAALDKYLQENPELQGLMDENEGKLKRTLTHVMSGSSDRNSGKSRRRKVVNWLAALGGN